MRLFDRKKKDAQIDANLEREAHKAWKESPMFDASQQKTKEDRVKKLGDAAFAHNYGPHPPLRDDDKYDDEEYTDEEGIVQLQRPC